MEWIPIVFLTFKAIVLFTGMFFAIKWHYDQDRKKTNATSGPQSPTDMRLFATMLVALALSLIGVVYAGCWGHAVDGGRGGALGFAFTIFMLFMSKPVAEAGLISRLEQGSNAQRDVLAEPVPATLSEGLEQIESLKVQTGQLRATLVARLNSATREKVYLSVASVVSTLAWKFGDIAAAWFNFGH